MKVIYIEEVESHNAFSRKMWCPKCGNHYYELVRQVEPPEMLNWYVRCPECGHEGLPSSMRKIAVIKWKQEGKE